MNKILIIFIMISSILYAKKDFYYSYINPDLTQISDEQKQKIINGNGKLDTIRRYLKEGQLGLALKEIEIMKHNNKIEILTSDILLLNSRILYNLDTKKRALEALDILEVAVNESKINQNNLLEAYELLVLLNIRINKIKEAEYYAKVIATSFDDPVSKIHGKIALAQIHIKKREYRTAIKILKQELVEATNLETATIIADELYDALILNKEKEEAYTLSKKVLEKNIDYYANDSYKALKKVNKLLAAKMPEFAINIINRLLENSKDPKSIKNFKFILANTYMDLAGYEKKYLPMAKEIYKDLIQSQEDNPYFKRSKMYLDEIIMREGKFDPQMIAAKYSGFESMQYKAMMQELLNAIDDEKYEQVIRMKKVYSGIYKEILNRYGYESIDQIYTIVNFKMLQYYLRNEQCEQLNTVIKELTDETLLSIIEDDNATDNLFNCMQELPENRVYLIAKNVYSQSLNPRVNFYLEKVAILLNKYDDAYLFSQKLDMINDGDTLSNEIMYRFLIYGNKNNSTSMEKFFSYARKNKEFISNNENNPLIIDFYYQFYLYLLKQNEEVEAIIVLNKLYEKQKEMNARVYSPFVELELAKYAKLDDNYEKSLEYLQFGLNIKRMKDGKSIDRKIKKEDLAQIYYEISQIYEYQGKVNKYKNIIKRCKNLKDVDSYYKKMCDKL